jgi:diacylglycerol O-acyltransferase
MADYRDGHTWPGRMNPTDALFWSMDKIADMRSTIGALVILEHAPPPERMRDAFEHLSYALVRMRQRVVEAPFGLAPPEWIEDPQFDLDYHLRHVAVPAPGTLAELLEEMSPLYATAFDRERPLWEAYVAEGMQGGGRGAVFVKMHHCMTDGVGGARLSESLLGDGSNAATLPERLPFDERSTTPAARLWRAMLHNLDEFREMSSAALDAVVMSARAPLATAAAMRRAWQTLMGFGSELTVARANSPLHTRRSLSRRLATFEMALADIDAVRARLDATNNDIVLTIVSGAMHRWHTSRGDDTHELRALVPVSLRRPDDANAGNRLALLAVSLPIGEPNPVRRLRIIQTRTGRVKIDHRATLYPWLARVMVAMPAVIAEQLSRQQTLRTNFVCTNVPGPRRLCALAGAAIECIYPYAPLVGDHPIAIALCSYQGTMFVGLDVDSLAMTDLPHFLDALQESYNEVLNVGRNAEVPRRRPIRRARRQHAAAVMHV